MFDLICEILMQEIQVVLVSSRSRDEILIKYDFLLLVLHRESEPFDSAGEVATVEFFVC